MSYKGFMRKNKSLIEDLGRLSIILNICTLMIKKVKMPKSGQKGRVKGSISKNFLRVQPRTKQ